MARVHYGIDAPGLVRAFLLTGLGLGLTSGVLDHLSASRPWMFWLAAALFAVSGYALFMFGYMLWGSLVAKVRGREKVLGLISWSGEERVLDVGCGRGLLLVGAAHRLTTGKAIGIDLWSQKDQSSNKQQATLDNAAAEGVADRVQVETGDMRRLPYAANSFDVVLSSWTLHNLESAIDRQTALCEMVRVLKPGGNVVLNDIALHDEYQDELRHIGMVELRLVIPSKKQDLFSSAVSFGSFRPATVVAKKPMK